MSTCAAAGPYLASNSLMTAGLAVCLAGLLSVGLAALASAGYLPRRAGASRRGSHGEAASAERAAAGWWQRLFGMATAGQAAQQEEEERPWSGEHTGPGEQEGLPSALTELDDLRETPEPFTDPITLGVMHDPVVLCGTGQVYNYPSLRAWLCTGQRKCPKTNLALVDVEVVRLPLLRHAVHEWMQLWELPVPALEPAPELLAAADPRFPAWAADLRCGDVRKRGVQAAAKINNVLIEWGQDAQPGGELQAAREAALEHVMDDLVWLLRHGDCYGAGVACAALAQYRREEHRQWLAAVAAIPATLLLSSPDAYARHSAARLLAVLVRVHAGMPSVLCAAGAVPGLLAQVDLRRPFPYMRCSAASALCGIAADSEGGGREEIRRHGGVHLLATLAREGDVAEEPGIGAADEQLARFNQRDAAWALLELRPSGEELAAEGLTEELLEAYKNCSQAWLHGKVSEPSEGYTPQELAQLRTGQAAEEAAGAEVAVA